MFPRAGRDSQWGLGSHEVNGKSGTPEEEGKNENGGFACAPSLCVAKNCCWQKLAKSPDGPFLQKFSSSLHHLLLQGQVYHNISILWVSCTFRKVIYAFGAYFPFHLFIHLNQNLLGMGQCLMQPWHPRSTRNQTGQTVNPSGLRRALRATCKPSMKVAQAGTLILEFL